MRWLGENAFPARYLTLDNASVLSAAREDPQGFVQGLEGPVVLDEVQRAPELFLPIKAAVDQDTRAGRFLLTGSANVLLLPQLADSLAGRMEILTLWPFSQGELAGGFPGAAYAGGGRWAAFSPGGFGVPGEGNDPVRSGDVCGADRGALVGARGLTSRASNTVPSRDPLSRTEREPAMVRRKGAAQFPAAQPGTAAHCSFQCAGHTPGPNRGAGARKAPQAFLDFTISLERKGTCCWVNLSY